MLQMFVKGTSMLLLNHKDVQFVFRFVRHKLVKLLSTSYLCFEEPMLIVGSEHDTTRNVGSFYRNVEPGSHLQHDVSQKNALDRPTKYLQDASRSAKWRIK